MVVEKNKKATRQQIYHNDVTPCMDVDCTDDDKDKDDNGQQQPGGVDSTFTSTFLRYHSTF